MVDVVEVEVLLEVVDDDVDEADGFDVADATEMLDDRCG
jgi:hypothetical protein